MICVSLDPFKAPKPQFRNPLTLHKVRKSSLKRGWGFTVTFTLDLDLHTLGMLFFVCNYGSDVKLKPFLSHWCQFCFENKVIPSDPCCLFISVYLLFFFFTLLKLFLQHSFVLIGCLHDPSSYWLSALYWWPITGCHSSWILHCSSQLPLAAAALLQRAVWLFESLTSRWHRCPSRPEWNTPKRCCQRLWWGEFVKCYQNLKLSFINSV